MAISAILNFLVFVLAILIYIKQRIDSEKENNYLKKEIKESISFYTFKNNDFNNFLEEAQKINEEKLRKDLK